MRNFKILYLCFYLLLMTGCQGTLTYKPPPISLNTSLFTDADFENFKSIPIESTKKIFAIDNGIKKMIRNKLLTIVDPTERAKELLRQIFKNKNIGLIYSSNANLVANDTFYSNMANCLSLTIMAYALAKEANLTMRFQQVDIPEFWVRNGSYNLLTGHINLLLFTQSAANINRLYDSNRVQIDFDPYVAKKIFPKHIIEKNTVIAMYYNNKAAQAIVDSKYNTAYAYLKEAVKTDPSYSNAWGNLGLLYRLTNHYELAKKTYLYTIKLNKNNLTALSNYAILMKMNGDITTYYNISRQLRIKRQNNPYYQALLADEEMYKGNFNLAIRYFKKAIDLNKNTHEFYFGLAKAYYRLDQIAKAKREIRKALSFTHSSINKRKYLAKLNLLNLLKKTKTIH